MTVKTLKEILDSLEDNAEVLFCDGIAVSSVYENVVRQPNSPEDNTMSVILFGCKLDHDDYVNSENGYESRF